MLPRSIATRAAFENAMALDVAMGGSTNTILHILAAAREGRARLHDARHRSDLAPRALPLQSRRRTAPTDGGCAPRWRHPRDPWGAAPWGLFNENVSTVHSRTVSEWLDAWDIRGAGASEEAIELFHAAPGCKRSAEAFSQSERWDTLDTDAEGGCIRDVAHAYSQEGGLAILYGNLAERGCVVKTAGVDESILTFSGPAVVVESQGRRGRPHSQRRREAW